MADTRTKRVSRSISVIQETRSRLASDGVQGMLFTLAHNASASMAGLHQLHKAGASRAGARRVMRPEADRDYPSATA